ncbi:hypothetical protein BXZ70DRAFT_921860 [Cristinia sonorae]|uniref:Uncharacterized protein n=1 Tax=Cristinia sonorae TaxID=1940300 RepID=A0A8K0UUF8_9AGAR|nr:hypothetical protein BXZ70DRAFT_921860 [Cristinia sonorae]
MHCLREAPVDSMIIGATVTNANATLSSRPPLPLPTVRAGMAALSLFLFLLCAPTASLAHQHAHSRRTPLNALFTLFKRSNVPPEGYFNPSSNGGSMLTSVHNTYPAGLGEPLNVIITGNSDPEVLKNQEKDGGLRNYFLSFGFSSECLGQHLGDEQGANLGDGHGTLNETAVIRWNYGDPELGSCRETIEGGNHFRFWVQDGPEGKSGAIFLATSYEMPIKLGHDIIVNGYNLGRDWLVGNITRQPIATNELTNTTTFSGQTSWANYTYQTDIAYTPGLLANSSDGVNHYLSVGVNGSNAIDGLVAVMTVKILSRPEASDVFRVLAPSWIISIALSLVPLPLLLTL